MLDKGWENNMRHSSTSRHRGDNGNSYCENRRRCWQSHVNGEGNGKGVKKKWWGCWGRYQKILKGVGKVVEDVKEMMGDD